MRGQTAQSDKGSVMREVSMAGCDDRTLGEESMKASGGQIKSLTWDGDEEISR